jgi:hypothetical protein
MIQGKPLFNLRLDIERCAYDIFVNGGPVARDLSGTPVHGEYPINHWLRSGSNEVAVHMIGSTEEPSECEVKVELRWKDDADPPDSTGTSVFTLAHDAQHAPPENPAAGSSPSGTFDSLRGMAASPQGNVHVAGPSLRQLPGRFSHVHVLSRTFEVGLPFPEWAFLRSAPLTLEWEYPSDEAQEPDYQRLLAAYTSLHDLLEKGKIDGFLDAVEERSHETDIAYFKTPGETRSELRGLLASTLNDPKYELATLTRKPGKPWGFLIGSRGTVSGLYQGARASTILRYQLKDGSKFSIIFPVLFRREGNGFVVTR